MSELDGSHTDNMLDNVDPDWLKIERDMKKVGLKNGLSDGRELNFQQSFDKGYEDGFKNGSNLGYLKFQSEQKNKLDQFPALKNATSGMCIVCTNEQENEDVKDIRNKQSELLKSSLEKIQLDLEEKEL